MGWSGDSTIPTTSTSTTTPPPSCWRCPTTARRCAPGRHGRSWRCCRIGQHFGRPYTPTDQAWIETLWGHVKAENPYLLAIGNPAVLAAELERVRRDYNAVRLHEGIGYVTPDDEHEGRGDAIRQARSDGLTAADQARRDHHRAGRNGGLSS
jgi:hypothetical protein